LIFELTEFDAVMKFQNRGVFEAVNRQLSKEPLIKRYSVIIRMRKKIEQRITKVAGDIDMLRQEMLNAAGD
jgi:hypothetical protein